MLATMHTERCNPKARDIITKSGDLGTWDNTYSIINAYALFTAEIVIPGLLVISYYLGIDPAPAEPCMQ